MKASLALKEAVEYAKPIVNELLANMIRVDTDFTAPPFKATDAETTRVHTMLVIGARDMEASTVSVRLHQAASKAPSRGRSDHGHSGEHQSAAGLSKVSDCGINGAIISWGQFGQSQQCYWLLYG